MSGGGGALSLSWTVAETTAALHSAGGGLVAPEDLRLLQGQEVDGAALPFLSDEALARMGVPTFGRRVRLLRAAQAAMDDEARRQGKFAPQILAPGAGGAAAPSPSSAASAIGGGEDLLRRDPYASSLVSPSSRAGVGASYNRFGPALLGADDAHLLDPAALQPAASVAMRNGGAAAATITRDYGVAQRLSRPAIPGRDGALLRGDADDVDRDRDAEERFVRDNDDEEDGQQYDSDVEREFVHPRSASAAAAFDPAAEARLRLSGGGPAALADFQMASSLDSLSRETAQPWLGQIAPPTRPPPFVASPPSRQLALEWVHGYRAFDSRSNLVYNAAGDIVYPVAGLVVVYRPSLRQQKYFRGHTDDVRCLVRHPSPSLGNFIASGQSGGVKGGLPVPPHICVWDSASSDLSRAYTLPCTLADKAIRAVAFSGAAPASAGAGAAADGGVVSGRYLASLSSDEFHSLKIWDWRRRMLLTAAKVDTAPIYMVRGNPRDESEWVTVGKRHLLFWHFDGHVLRNKRAVFGGGGAALGVAAPSYSSAVKTSGEGEDGERDYVSPVSFHSVCFSERGYACCGAENGAIYVFVSGKLAKTFSGVHRGKVLALEAFRGGFVSGGADGRVHVLDKKMDVVKSFQFSNKITSVWSGLSATAAAAGMQGAGAPSAHAAELERQDALLVGTQGADVFELRSFLDESVELLSGDESLEAVTRGHSDGELWGLAMARDGRHYLTVGEDNTLCLWSAEARRLLKRGILSDRRGHVLQLPGQGKGKGAAGRTSTSSHPVNQCARSVAVSPSGADILVGTNEGELLVFDTRTFARKRTAIDLAQYGRERGGPMRRSAVDGRMLPVAAPGNNSKEHWITCLSYSPSGHAVAAGTHGSVVVLLDATRGYEVRAVLDRSVRPVVSLDWSADGTLLETNDQALEVRRYHVDEQNLAAARALEQNAAAATRDVQWATRTNRLSWASSGVCLADSSAAAGAGATGAAPGTAVSAPPSDPRFINSVDAAPTRFLLASGDDDGLVKLWRCPALPGAAPLAYAGHSAHVTAVRFSTDERRLITLGGFDNAVFQWAVL